MNDKLLLADGTSFLLLADGVFFLLLASGAPIVFPFIPVIRPRRR